MCEPTESSGCPKCGLTMDRFEAHGAVQYYCPKCQRHQWFFCHTLDSLSLLCRQVSELTIRVDRLEKQ